MAEILSVARQVLHQQAASRLRLPIVEGAIAPGAKLDERELAERLQVSRTPLREAIKMLAAEGLVELLPNRGAVAVQLSAQDVADTSASTSASGRAQWPSTTRWSSGLPRATPPACAG
jgi:DNA-binding GntR family transcriptional regulator